MRVVHVTNSSKTNMLGVERYVLNLAIAQKADGFSVKIIIDRPGMLADACRQHGIPVAVIESLTLKRPGERAITDLIDQYESHGAELIHCHTPPAAERAIPAANRVKIPCTISLHATGGDIGSALAGARRAGLKFSAIAVTKALYEDLKKRGFSGTELYYVTNGTRAVPLARRPGPRQPHCPELIFVGSLKPRKGVDVAILSIVELRRRRAARCPALNIYGDGDQEGYLKEMVTVLGLNNIVQFHGTKSDILKHCADTDILVMSSREETGPMVVLEAMSRGMPIVASDVGEVVEMLPDQRYGRIVPPDSIVALADAVESLLSDIADGKFDPRLLIERHQSFYTSERMVERIAAIYRQMLSRR